MPRLSSATDRPKHWKLLLRRQRRRLRPVFWLLGCAAIAALLVQMGLTALRHFDTAMLRERLGISTAAIGLRVKQVRIEGRATTPEPLLRAAIGVAKGSPILGFSVAGAKARIESLSWVQTATVERRLPDTILVVVKERRPFAVWQNQGKFLLVDRDGQAVPDQDIASFSDLPLVVGAGAPASAAALLDLLGSYPTIMSHLVAAVRVGERRWNLNLSNGCDVLLPEDGEAAALQRLAGLQQAHAVLDRPLQVIDLRLPDRLVIRPHAEAGQDAHPDPRTDPLVAAPKPTPTLVRRPT
jgi:cell division protein FtsQ